MRIAEMFASNGPRSGLFGRAGLQRQWVMRNMKLVGRQAASASLGQLTRLIIQILRNRLRNRADCFSDVA
jgi:hypothetical protein